MSEHGVDIVVMSPTGQMSVVVEVKVSGELDAASAQVEQYMRGVGATTGLVFGAGEIRILRETFVGEPSIQVIGQYPIALAHDLLPSNDELGFESAVQTWLESLPAREHEVEEPLLSALRLHAIPALIDGAVWAARPRVRTAAQSHR